MFSPENWVHLLTICFKLLDSLLHTRRHNSKGILCKVKTSKYEMGKTWNSKCWTRGILWYVPDVTTTTKIKEKKTHRCYRIQMQQLLVWYNFIIQYHVLDSTYFSKFPLIVYSKKVKWQMKRNLIYAFII